MIYNLSCDGHIALINVIHDATILSTNCKYEIRNIALYCNVQYSRLQKDPNIVHRGSIRGSSMDYKVWKFQAQLRRSKWTLLVAEETGRVDFRDAKISMT